MSDPTAAPGLTPSTYPQSLTHWYPAGQPNEPIPVYAGPARLYEGRNGVDASVSVALVWQPGPWIEWQALTDESNARAIDHLLAGDLRGRELRMPPLADTVPSPPSTIKELTLSGPGGLEEGRESSVLVAQDSAVDEVRFSLVNMPKCQRGTPVQGAPGAKRAVWLGRQELVGAGWSIQLDSPHVDVEAHLNQSGGYGVTHAGKLCRTDGSTFNRDEADDVLRLLTYVCTLAAGRRVAVILPVGFTNGRAAWAIWRSPRVDTWRERLRFTDPLTQDHLPRLFIALANRWFRTATDAWTVRRSIDYYVDASDAAPLQRSVASAVSACELLACCILADVQPMTERDRANADFAEAGAKALSHIGYNTAIPASLSMLTRHSNRWHSGTTGPRTLHEMRHWVVHPRSGREGEAATTTEIWIEAWRLALEYFQLLLLYWCGYDGTRRSPLTIGGWLGQTEPLPWTDANLTS